MNESLIFYCSVIFVCAFAGGVIAILKRWSDSLLHLFISFGAGVFLGAVFFELLPDAMSHENKVEVSIAILVGYMLIFSIERVLLVTGKEGYDHSHKVISIAAFTGLSVHSLIDGLGLSVGSLQPEIGRVVFLSILAHHVPAAFSVASLLTLGRFSRGKVLSLLVLFAATPALGASLFAPIFSMASDRAFGLLTGLMTGTFLYVATGDLLPEVFHSKAKRWRNLLLLLVGITVIALVALGFQHIHRR